VTHERASAGTASYCTRRSTPEPVGVSVVICAYTEQRWPLLESAVNSVFRQDQRPTEVVVVVDHNPRLHARLKDRFDDVQVHHNGYGRGLSGARNTGVAASQGEVVAFLDDDARAEPGWLAAHARHYADAEVLGVGGRVHPDWQEARPSWFPEEFAWVVGCTHSGIRPEVQRIRNPIGANMSFRRRSVEAVGGFREGLGRVGAVPLGCEETELAIRVTSADPNARVVYEPSAVVRHHVPLDRATWVYFSRRCWAEGISKAHVSRLAGTREGLSEERGYVSRTLPAGIGRSIREATELRDHRHLARAGAIVAGLAVTTGGYVTGRVRTGMTGGLVAPAGPLRTFA
jgi:GT2 family glycosyltransferase